MSIVINLLSTWKIRAVKVSAVELRRAEHVQLVLSDAQRVSCQLVRRTRSSQR